MNTLRNIIFALFVLTVALAGCKKDQGENNIPSSPTYKSVASSKMLKFKNADDFFEALKLNSSFDNTERAKWEDAQDFVSFGRVCDDFYFSLDETIFEDDKTVEEIVKANPDKLQLIEDDNGEFSLETVLFKQNYRYFANKDKMFQIGDIIYLILEDVTVSADQSKIGKLKEITESNYLSYTDDVDVSFSTLLTESHLSPKDDTYNCGNDAEQRVTNDRERTYFSISIITMNTNGTNQYVYYLVRPYKKTLGIWYWCTRHISCSIKVAFDYPDYTSYYSYVWKRKIDDDQRTNVYASSISGELCSTWISTGFTAPSSPRAHFGGYNCWADTPSTNPNVVLQCNTFLCP